MAGDASPWHCYHAAGLVVRSRLALPEWESQELVGLPEEPQVAIELAAPRDISGEVLPLWDGASLSFSVRGTGRWDITGGIHVTITPDPSAKDHALRLFTLGSAWAAIGYQRGWAMLHGSAVEIGGKAVLLSGAQERGKSTLAAAMAMRGHALLADDLVRVDPARAGEAALLHPVPPRFKLWRDAVEQLDLQGDIVARDHFREDKFQLAIGQAPRLEPVPLGAIVLLEWSSEPSLTSMSGAAAVRAVVAACTFRPEMLAAMALEAEQGALLARIVSATPVFRLARPRDFARLAQSCELLERLEHAGPRDSG